MSILSTSLTGRSGSLVILTSWILFALGALALAVAAHVSANMASASAVKLRTTAHYLARAGIEQARMVLAADSNAWDDATELWATSRSSFKDVRLDSGAFNLSYIMRNDAGLTVTNYGLVDEDRRISLNIPSENFEILRSMLILRAGEGPAGATTIANSILDWKDEDEEPREDGAENDYYQSLEPPYDCHDGVIDIAEELLLIKNMTPELLTRVDPVLTVSGQGRVNINTAGRDVLAILAHSRGAGVTEAYALADKIIEYRLDGNAFVIGGRVAEMRDHIIDALEREVGLTEEQETILRAMVDQGLLTIRSTYFRGVSRGTVWGRGNPDSELTFVINRNNGEIVYWHEE